MAAITRSKRLPIESRGDFIAAMRSQSNLKPRPAFSRRSFLKTLGGAALTAPFVTRGLMAQSPNSVVRHASFGAAGMAWSDITELTKYKELQLVAVAELDVNRTV